MRHWKNADTALSAVFTPARRDLCFPWKTCDLFRRWLSVSIANLNESAKPAKLIPSISVQSLTGCAGELLVILENLQKMLPYVRILSFPFAQSKNSDEPVDITFVEGSVSNPHDLEKLKAIRERSKRIVAVGNCAVWGCVQKGACSRIAVEEMRNQVYGAQSKNRGHACQPDRRPCEGRREAFWLSN